MWEDNVIMTQPSYFAILHHLSNKPDPPEGIIHYKGQQNREGNQIFETNYHILKVTQPISTRRF